MSDGVAVCVFWVRCVTIVALLRGMVLCDRFIIGANAGSSDYQYPLARRRAVRLVQRMRRMWRHTRVTVMPNPQLDTQKRCKMITTRG